ncbi:hypothetical protein L1987_75195 [Smallanthus sonchifolius]|uniref:Uncharacterized protein n=1 Tax=Smallanthus sonchifolius TaxID=185202 RepID=A0ACB9A969_9ASTR|nr:hypothetical protein L1987_75195 [Smallanthus sonchifolius]
MANQYNIWQQTIYTEVEKRKGLETELKHVKDMFAYYVDRTLKMEELLQKMEADEKKTRKATHKADEPEEVQSNFNSSSRLESYRMCSLCRSRLANIVLLPCRHLCFCAECDNSRRDACLVCKICDTHRITSIKVNLI